MAEEFEVLFREPERIQRAFDAQLEGLPEKEAELIDILG
jgi:hypothetical protein